MFLQPWISSGLEAQIFTGRKEHDLEWDKTTNNLAKAKAKALGLQTFRYRAVPPAPAFRAFLLTFFPLLFIMESPKLDEASKYERKTASPRASDLDNAEGEVFDNADNLQRRLGNRQIQLIAIGGSIGTALFVSINSGLYHGGPGSLLIAYFLYSCMLGLVNNCVAEMSTYMPVSGGFIRLAGTRKFPSERLQIKTYHSARSLGRRSFWVYGGLELLLLRSAPDSVRNYCAEHCLEVLGKQISEIIK